MYPINNISIDTCIIRSHDIDTPGDMVTREGLGR